MNWSMMLFIQSIFNAGQVNSMENLPHLSKKPKIEEAAQEALDTIAEEPREEEFEDARLSIKERRRLARLSRAAGAAGGGGHAEDTLVLDKRLLCDCGDKVACLEKKDPIHYCDWSQSGRSKPFNTPEIPLLKRKDICYALGLSYNPNGRFVSQERLKYFIIDEFGRCFVGSNEK